MVVPEPSVDETYEIMLGLRERYEAHHKLRYTDDSLMAAAKYASQYISDRFLPDKVRGWVLRRQCQVAVLSWQCQVALWGWLCCASRWPGW